MFHQSSFQLHKKLDNALQRAILHNVYSIHGSSNAHLVFRLSHIRCFVLKFDVFYDQPDWSIFHRQSLNWRLLNNTFNFAFDWKFPTLTTTSGASAQLSSGIITENSCVSYHQFLSTLFYPVFTNANFCGIHRPIL